MRIVFLDRATFADAVRFDTAPLGPCEWVDHPVTKAAQVLERAAGAEVLVTNKVKLPDSLLAELPALRLIAAAATGIDNIDTAAAKRREVAVCNVRGYATRTVPEHVFAVLLALRRNLASYQQAARDGEWSRSQIFCLHTYPNRDLAGSTMGIVGFGSLGQAVAKLAEAFGMQVLVADRPGVSAPRPGRVAFDDVLRTADVLTLHLPHAGGGAPLIGARELALMRPEAILINTARGALVDADALLEALRNRRLGGAGLDVLSIEPPPADDPLLAARLPNLIITPHIAWASLEAQQQLADEVIANIAAFLRGEARNRVV
jgi:glycerate dehydrogenase